MTKVILAESPFNGCEAKAHAAASIIQAKEHYLMLRKTRLWPGMWTCPGGRIETGELLKILSR